MILPKLIIGDKEINYAVRLGKGSKYVYLRFTKNLDLVVTLPKNSNIDPEKIVREKHDWIEKKYQELSKRKPVFDGKRILYKGRCYELEIVRSDRASVKLDKDKITFFTKNKMGRKDLLRDWMTRKTKKYLQIEIPAYAEKFGVMSNGFEVKDMKKWGYCSRNGKLTFNWQIIALPKELAEYVILHEIAHLSEFNHSKNFRYKLASMCPDFVEREMMLKSIVPIG